MKALGTDAFPIFRLDADASTLEARARTLQAFEAARAGVLVGTQMVAKGHDFPDVSLGVVIDADQTLRFPDFRSEERTFALVTQLAGRTGRGVAAARRATGSGRGCSCRRSPPTHGRCGSPPDTTPTGSSPMSWAGGGRCAIRRSRR